jgi:ubiquinone biosynthesis protein UbiJ
MDRLKFNCVEMQHQGAAAILEELKGMTRNQELAYWHEQTEQLKRRQQFLQQQAARESNSG